MRYRLSPRWWRTYEECDRLREIFFPPEISAVLTDLLSGSLWFQILKISDQSLTNRSNSLVRGKSVNSLRSANSQRTY